jgi:hypothetical protein
MPDDLLTPAERQAVEWSRACAERQKWTDEHTMHTILEALDRLAPRPVSKTPFVKSDGGRVAAGFVGDTGDCTCRAIAHATGKPYLEVYQDLNEWGAKERRSKRYPKKGSARTGVYNKTIRKYMAHLGWTWHPCMTIGSGCTTHLKASELPTGWLVIQLSKHMTAMIDGVIYDTYDPSRDGTRCVYGYFTKDK